MKVIEFDEVSAACIQALEHAGVPRENALVQTDLLMEAELRGRPSHGIQRLPRVVARIRNGVANPAVKGRGTWRGNSFLDVDGQHGLGPVVAFEALTQVAVRAKNTGIAVAAIRNCNHIGMLALYAERIAQNGQILIAMTTSEALVHPWGGRRAMVGTNPLAIGVPAQPRPFVLDMATSLVSMGQIHDYANRGAPLASGWALDAHGNPTTDAAAARDGAIAPFGGPKGYALGLALEVLVASLTDSAIGRDVRGTLDATQLCNKGDIFIVLEPAGSTAGASVNAYLDAVRACVPADPARPVVVPGDRAQVTRERSLSDGLSIPDDVWHAILELANTSTTQPG